MYLFWGVSLNHKTPKNMDKHVRMWGRNNVVTHFLTLEFMGHATAEYMVTHFRKSKECSD